MSTAYIELLQKRIDGLNEKDYNLEAWKSVTSLLLTRIFGEGNSYSKEIEAMKVDYSSWSLRDATSDYNPREACKRLGHEILELAITELQVPKQQEQNKLSINTLLKGQSVKLEEAIANKDKQLINNLLKGEKKETLVSLLSKLLLEL